MKDLWSVYEIYRIIKKSKPCIIISYAAKPVIYTGLVLKLFKKIKYYPMITGLGYAFIERNSIKQKLLKYLLLKLYHEGLKSSKKIMFQNKDDKYLFLKKKIIKNKKLPKMINGSGVDLRKYPKSSLPSKPVFLMIARLLVDKGVREYVQAAEIVRKNFPNTIFQLAGGIDENPASISSKELKLYIKQGNINYLGDIKSVQLILKNCKFYVLPSYRGHLAQPALSTGDIITTDAPGCREQ